MTLPQHENGNQTSGAMICVSVTRTRDENQVGSRTVQDRRKVLLQIARGIRVSGNQRIGIRNSCLGGEPRAVGCGLGSTENGEQTAIRIAEKELLPRRDAEQAGGFARLLHALSAEIAKLLRIDQQALLDYEKVELGGIATGHPEDCGPATRTENTLDRSRAAKTFVIRMRRDDEERCRSRNLGECIRPSHRAASKKSEDDGKGRERIEARFTMHGQSNTQGRQAASSDPTRCAAIDCYGLQPAR
jgi:hypothetical protein